MADPDRQVVGVAAPRGRRVAQRGVVDDAETREAELRALDSSAQATQIAYRLLSVRMRSRRELTDRLRRRGFPEGLVRGLLDKLEAARLVDDARFAEAWVSDRSARRPSGIVRLRRELAQKGIEHDVAERALAEGCVARDERELALRVARACSLRYRALPHATAVRRLAGVLRRRGFAMEVVMSVVQQTLGQSNGISEA